MTVHELRERTTRFMPKNSDMRGFLDIARWVLERIQEKGPWSFSFGNYTLYTVADYSVGSTVSVTYNSTTVTGTGTAFDTALTDPTARKIEIAGVEYGIASVTSATVLVLDRAYAGTTDTTADYVVYQMEYALQSDVRTVKRVWDFTNQHELKAVDYLSLRRTHIYSQNASDPCEYAATGLDSSYNKKIAFWPYPTEVLVIGYSYEKLPTTISGPSTDLAMPSWMDSVLIQGVLARVLEIAHYRGARSNYRDARNEFENMLFDRRKQDQPLRDYAVQFERRDHMNWMPIGPRVDTSSVIVE